MSQPTENITFDLLVIGAGIVGLASAYTFLQQYPDKKVLVLEKEEAVGKHQSGNNSGVIHSGVYYKPGSSKAINCRKGYKMLLEFAKEHDIKHEVCGKIIVAVKEEELPLLETIHERGVENGLEGLRFLNSEEIKEIEPHVRGIKAIHVPQAGIIDYPGMCLKLEELICQKGGSLLFKQNVQQIIPADDSVTVKTNTGSFTAAKVVSCAGLFSDRVSNMTSEEEDLRIIPFRGEYYKLKPESQGLVKHLIYPVPDPNFPFLGVHFTRMIEGGIEAGPNAVLAFKREGYKFFDVNLKDLAATLRWPGFWKIVGKYGKTGTKEMYRSLSKRQFTKALQGLIPEVKMSDLEPGGAGVRAQACDREGKLLDDFDIQRQGNVMHVRNAPSPAATSSLAIGESIINELYGH
ncbi:L-2-hydroxyglutarate oxidase [Gilvibacter sp.]|uniref:L-2-hydroxyglutarate oxidase n=1 Tax=Gilvibacter sp. TaxID=2729997 RepID=UPI0025BC29EA|nr:L-2-hydroxyglutarate oxidase [Gilvibacter sp.]